MPDEIPSGARSAKGLKGLLQRRAEAMLRKPGRASAALTEPGEFHVVLQLIGARPLQVMAVIRQATGLDVISAGNLAQEAPVVVASGISAASAELVVGRLERAGAKAVAGETYQPD
ncbi:MAG: ribosomal protein L7/L12 [Dermatophilaceae bacterium]